MVEGNCRHPVRGRDRGAALTRLLLDTTFLIDAERSAIDLDDALGDDDEVAVAAITAAELRVGVLLSSGKNRAARLAFLDDVLAVVPVLDYDRAVAESHAELLVHVRHQGRPRGAHDLIIAATARAASRTVVSADDTAFADLPGVEVQTHR
ncbi:MAG: PIN domain-containing protein [Actinomycetota bacterium]|nr:PIN domain-containing protein [Actinomycetota bacterium]